jgi:hypothetical protein
MSQLGRRTVPERQSTMRALEMAEAAMDRITEQAKPSTPQCTCVHEMKIDGVLYEVMAPTDAACPIHYLRTRFPDQYKGA